MQEASADVGSTANTQPAASAASATRCVTTPASVHSVGVACAKPGKTTLSTACMAVSFSVLMTTLCQVRGIAPPV